MKSEGDISVIAENLAINLCEEAGKTALSLVKKDLVVGALTIRDYEPVEAEAYSIYKIPGSNTEFILNKHMEASVLIPDAVRAADHPGLLSNYLLPTTVALAGSIESDLLKLHDRFANRPIVCRHTPITEDVCDRVEAALSREGPRTAPKYFMLGPGAYSGLRDGDLRVEETAVANQRPGVPASLTKTVRRVKDLYAFASPHVVQKTADVSCTYNLAFAMGALGMVMRRPSGFLSNTGIVRYAESEDFGLRATVERQRSTGYLSIYIELLYGVGVLRNGFGVQVIT